MASGEPEIRPTPPPGELHARAARTQHLPVDNLDDLPLDEA